MSANDLLSDRLAPIDRTFPLVPDCNHHLGADRAVVSDILRQVACVSRTLRPISVLTDGGRGVIQTVNTAGSEP